VRELELEPQCARAVGHNKAKFVQIVLELLSQEPLALENTCKNLSCRYIIELASHKNLKYLYVMILEISARAPKSSTIEPNFWDLNLKVYISNLEYICRKLNPQPIFKLKPLLNVLLAVYSRQFKTFYYGLNLDI